MPDNAVVVTLDSRRRERRSEWRVQPGEPRVLKMHPVTLRLNSLQNLVLREAQRRWGAAALAFLKALVEAETWKVDEWLHRLPFYFNNLSDLVHCRPLPVRRIRHDELIRRAVSDPLSCWLLVLIANPGPRLREHGKGIDYGVPCLQFTEQGTLVASDLVLNRCSYLAVEDPRLARALFDHLPKGKQFVANPVSASLAFALIPVDIGNFVGYQPFSTISDVGKPLPQVHACHYDLLTLRGLDVPEGREDPTERHIIQILQTRARGAGFILPEIVTTKVRPAWSRMSIPSPAALSSMRRVAGV